MVPRINIDVRDIKLSEKGLKTLDRLGILYEVVDFDFNLNPADFILLEGRDAGKDSYPDLHVCKYRLGVNPAVVATGRKIGLTLQDTATEKNGRGYIGNINREQALRLNLSLGGRTLNWTQSPDFMKLLLSGKAYDGNGKRVKTQELSGILDEIIGVRDPWRSEWTEDYFTNVAGKLNLNKNYRLENGVLIPSYSEVLQSCLMESRIPGISFKDWIKRANLQGLPPANIRKGREYYWPPRANSGAGFDVGSGRSLLDCGRYLAIADPWLGVRHVREAHEKK